MEKTLAVENLLSDLDRSTADLLETMTGFSQEEFNQLPFEGSWTAGQVAEHLFKSESGLPVVLTGRAVDTERPYNEKAEAIRSIFLDFTRKFDSPSFILPSDKVKNRNEFLERFKKNREEIKRLINSTDLAKSFPDVPFPGLDVFTGWEWVYFITCHSIRHTRQMKNIFSILKKGK